MAENEITSAVDLLIKIRDEDEVTIEFIKKDGSTRIMRCTLKFDRIPKDQQPKKIDLAKVSKLLKKNKILHVFDLDKNGWRSIPFDNSKQVKMASQKLYKIKPNK